METTAFEKWPASAIETLRAALGKRPESRTVEESRAFFYFAEKRLYRDVETVWRSAEAKAQDAELNAELKQIARERYHQKQKRRSKTAHERTL